MPDKVHQKKQGFKQVCQRTPETERNMQIWKSLKQLIREACAKGLEAIFVLKATHYATKGKNVGCYILRSRKMPDFGFLMFTGDWTSGSRKIGFKNATGTEIPDSFRKVFCACCGCHLPQMLIPFKAPSQSILFKDNDSEKWRRLWKEINERTITEFSEKLHSVCKRNGIKNLFVRHADHWVHHLGKTQGIVIYEAEDYLKVMGLTYNRETIQQAFKNLVFSFPETSGE